MAAPAILFRCDASPEIGGGHVMRCLTLAHALAGRGCTIRFASARGTAQAVWALDASGFERFDLDDPRDPNEVEAKAGGGYHIVVVDHYGLAHDYERHLRGIGGRILVIDDLVDRPHDCDFLLDQSLGRVAEAYRDLIPPHAVVLAGSTYAMIRPEFLAARDVALGRHRVESPGRRVLVSLGLTDVGGISEQVTRSLIARRPGIDIDVVLGASAPSLPVLEALAAQHEKLRVHVDTARIGDLMTTADVAIGAGGTTSWERCCLGLPTVLLVLADNQIEVGRALEEIGAAVCAGNSSAAVDAADALLDAPHTRAQMAAAAAAIIDGRGVERIVARLLPPSHGQPSLARFSASPVARHDAEAIWLWRNDPQTRAVSLTNTPIDWEGHLKWLDRTMADADSLQLMVSTSEAKMGIVRFARLGETAEALVSINLDPAWRGQGVGRAALKCAIAHYDRAPLADTLVADIALDNAGSVAIFEACGFRRMSELGEGRFARYRRSKPLASEAE